MERELQAANDEVEASRKELKMSNRIEKEMFEEAKKQQAKVSELEAALSSQRRESKANPDKIEEMEKVDYYNGELTFASLFGFVIMICLSDSLSYDYCFCG